MCLHGSEEAEQVVQLSQCPVLPLCSHDILVSYFLYLAAGFTPSVCPIPETSGMPCKSYPTEAGHGAREGRRCLCPSSPFVSPLSLFQAGHRQGKARHDSTSLLCPALPLLLTASVIPACSLPASAHPVEAAASMLSAPGGSGCQEDFFQLAEERLKSRLHRCTGVW